MTPEKNPAAAITNKSSSHILVVDDNPLSRELLKYLLTQSGYQVSLAQDGKDAMKQLTESDFDLMVLDIEMPHMDGFEVLEALKINHKLQQLPVIVVSSAEGIGRAVKCIESGAEDYLTKPVNNVVLNARVSASLEKKALRDNQRAWLRRIASPEVVEEIASQGFKLDALEAKEVIASVLFADIRSFTKLSETLGPKESIKLLNMFYAAMFEVISPYSGVVSNMMGDGLMTIFGAPAYNSSHAESAVRAGIDMLAKIESFNVQLQGASKPELKIGIGIATGPMVAGYTGTQDRVSYTCIGDTVNVAARLESLTKEMGVNMLIAGTTKINLPKNFEAEFQPHGHVQLRGKTLEVEVFSVHPKA